MNERYRWVGRAGVVLVIAMVASSCLYYPAAVRTRQASGGAEVPWWCEGSPAATANECELFSAALDVALVRAHAHPTVADATAAGATAVSTPSGTGSGYLLPGGSGEFRPGEPSVLLYAGSAPGDRIAGVAHLVTNGSASPPEGYAGDRDEWLLVDALAGTWFLPVWIVRPYENHPDVFAPSHPCLEPGVTLAATTDACYLASHTEPLDVLVTNDDGIAADGITALVDGLLAVPGIDITIVAPATNQSGTGDTTTPGGVTSSPGATGSGVAGTAVDGTPADSVLHALVVLGETPDLVISGINAGQNMGPVVELSGTVGAARTAARAGVPAVATSQGFSATPDFPAGVDATLAWLEDFRLGRAGRPDMEVANINTPSCPTGSVRGTVVTTVATSLSGRSYSAQDCESTLAAAAVADDVDAFNNGFVGIADVGLGLH